MTGLVKENITFVLRSPRYPENIGSAARAIKNMGFTRLIVINPEDFDPDKIQKLATHEAADVVEQIEVFSEINEALSSFNYIAGTTARMGKLRQAVYSPQIAADKISSVSTDNKIAILFGPEDRGLTNNDIRYCHTLINIPTSDFSSLNLAQAVMIMSYELFITDNTVNHVQSQRLATSHELEGMYDQLKDILIRISFLNPENPEYWLDNIRRFFSRLPLRAKEVSIIRGICRQINWYGNKKYQDGKLSNDRILME